MPAIFLGFLTGAVHGWWLNRGIISDLREEFKEVIELLRVLSNGKH
jgi:hypothetical protein